MKIVKKPIELSLCGNCASDFYEAKDRWIERMDPLQVITDECFFCRCPWGFDFRIHTVPPRRTRTVTIIVDHCF